MKKLPVILVVVLALIVSATAVLQLQKNRRNLSQPTSLPTPAPVVKIEGTNLAITGQNQVVISQEDLPVLFLPASSSFVEGQTIEDNQIKFVTKLVAHMSKTDFQPRTIRIISADEVVVYDAFGKIVITTSLKSADSQVDSLQQTLAAAKIGRASLRESKASLREDGDKISKIDLRFEKPVITFK